MRYLYLFTALLAFQTSLLAQSVSGIVTDDKGVPLSFSSILVKGKGIGTSTNVQGFFTLNLEVGKYTLVAQHVGYKTVEQEVTVTKEAQKIAFQLPLQEYTLSSVVVKNTGEDPAYEIIRNAIKKRKQHEEEYQSFKTQVYIKGIMRLRSFPKRVFGQKVDFEDGDTSKKKIIFLSETLAEYFKNGADAKVNVLSTKVSGSSNGFGFSEPRVINMYRNNLMIGESLNPRGFISPISDNALSFYKFKFRGTFYDNGYEISRIQVIPKRSYEPLFSGYINIIEKEWRLYSTELLLLKENQMQLLDTLKIEQQYAHINNTWVIQQQVVYPATKLLGFDAYGSFVQVYDKFEFNPNFGKKFFDNTVLTFQDSSNKKPMEYWDKIRPIPLQKDEIVDYQKKDSLEQLRKQPKYLDSLDKKNNKINVLGLFAGGQEFYYRSKKLSFSTPSLLDMTTFNVVEGLSLRFNPTITKRFDDVSRRRLTISPQVQYGFSNRTWHAYSTNTYTFGKKYFNFISIAGGRRLFQFNNAQPITPRDNTITSLYFRDNFMKLYQAWYAKFSFQKGLGDGLSWFGNIDFQDRNSVNNTTDYSWNNKENEKYGPNFPEEIQSAPFAAHKALSLAMGIQWQPGAKYVQYPDRKVMTSSKYPTLTATLKQGVPNVLGSNVDYTRYRFTIEDDLNMRIGGKLSYRTGIAGFLSANKVFTPDYLHYFGNQLSFAQPFLQSFQMGRYYEFSNANKFNAFAHVEYHLNGLITNKIPGFRKLNWFVVTGANAITTGSQQQYVEAFIGLENIFKIMRIDFVRGFRSNGTSDAAFRFSFSGVFSGSRED
ncbi:MAG: carboxypeptidase-like regulatory domain-containing protein [Bacteroidetes bacterium]|nr:MAG: carboxypeptidase-like regulatory domain-containing protein [Bacteroidota bacterium]